MKIILRFEASHKVGLGHLYRCLALAKEIQKRGHDPILATKIYPETAEALMSCGYEVISLKPTGTLEEETNAIRDSNADAIVVDMLDTTQDYMKGLKDKCRFLLTIDNNGDGAKVADKVVNVLYNKIAGDNVINDFSYAMLRPQFAELNQTERGISPAVQQVLVLQGGADTHGLMPKIINALDGSDFQIIAITGSASKTIIEQKKGLKVFRNVENIEDFMLNADMAISAAGMSLLELLCVGTPSIAVCAERFEEETAQKLESLDATINLGFGGDVSEEEIRNAVESLASDFERRKSMSLTGKNIVDGKGSEKTVNIIEEGLNSRR